MAKANNTKKILVWSTVVAILGVGAYLGFKWYKKKKLGSGDNPLITPEKSVIESAIESVVNIGAESPFKTTAEIQAFQDWLDVTHPLWINDNGKWKNLRIGTATEPTRHVSGKGYGTYGKSTASAYSKWGSEYAVKPKTDKPIVDNSVKPNSNDIDKIKGSASISTAEKNGLIKRNAEFIKNWANALRNNRSTFVWANQIYRSLTGVKILNYNPMLKAHIVKNGGFIAYPYPTLNGLTSPSKVDKGTKVGLVRDIKFSEGNLWFYLPDNGGFEKWGIAENFSRI